MPNYAVGKPAGGGRIGEIDHACVKFAKIHGIKFVAVLPQCEIIVHQRLLIERAIHGQIGINITQKANATLRQRGYTGWQIWIARCIPFPVPKQPLSKAGLPDADPIFAPQARYRCARGRNCLETVECVCSVFKAHNRAGNRPFGQRWLPAKAIGQFGDQIGQRWCLKQLQIDIGGPAFDANATLFGQIQNRVCGCL